MSIITQEMLRQVYDARQAAVSARQAAEQSIRLADRVRKQILALLENDSAVEPGRFKMLVHPSNRGNPKWGKTVYSQQLDVWQEL